MTTLTPLIELATQKNLDLFFRVGRGYVARVGQEAMVRVQGTGLAPEGLLARAEARIVATLGHIPRDRLLNAWPVPGPAVRR